eukprot:gnl/Chilomastix_cuspidata/3865.p1 GENE.gnl/Chilomastix_cuspidata/3865~~gnl/Chilomastix_cuspidata/3865.p1  ORF type:complete len:412 (-),score=151.25 gnl/Chilomastix_cuspidata/3865:90-1325(-)
MRLSGKDSDAADRARGENRREAHERTELSSTTRQTRQDFSDGSFQRLSLNDLDGHQLHGKGPHSRFSPYNHFSQDSSVLSSSSLTASARSQARLRSQIDTVIKTRNALSEQLQVVDGEISHRDSLLYTERSEASRNVQALREERDALLQRQEELRLALRMERSGRAPAQAPVEAPRAEEDSLPAIERKCTQAEERLREVEAIAERLRTEVEGAKREREELTRSCSAARRHTEELARFKNNTHSLRLERSKLQEQFEEEAARSEALRRVLREREEAVARLQRNLAELREAVQVSATEAGNSYSTRSKLEQRVQKLRRSLAEQKDLRRELVEQTSQLSSRTSELMAENEALRTQRAALEHENAGYKTTAERITLKLEEAQQEQQRLSQEVTEMKELRATAKTVLELLRPFEEN